MRTSSPFHAVTWLLWAAAAASAVQLAPSPVYVALVLATAALVVEVHRLDSMLSRAFPLLVGAGAAFALLRVVLTALTTHTGSHHATVWFTLPHGTLPKILGGFVVGGPIEAAVVLQAAAEGLAIVGIMAAFGAFNAVASHHELLQAAPRAFHEPGLIVTVALAFVPSTLAAVAAVREADRARTGGRVVRRGRLVRLAVPILESGMERAVALAESMDARGFARLPATAADRVAGWLGLGALLGLGGSFVALVGQRSGVALGLGAASLLALVAAIWLASSGNRPTRYRPRRLTRIDYLMGATALLAPAGLVLLGLAHRGGTLRWSATSPLAFPSFSLLPALCIALLAAPAAWPPRKPSDRQRPAVATTGPSAGHRATDVVDAAR
ncbi:MAG: Cobalt transport protein [Acidimicrobiales bacterium]|nr:Cobalt transport protein [Acidimicrobiales bacterium]